MEMPHDKNGQLLQAGDKVIVEFAVKSVCPGEYCNCELVSTEVIPGNGHPATLSAINTKQVVKVAVAEPAKATMGDFGSHLRAFEEHLVAAVGGDTSAILAAFDDASKLAADVKEAIDGFAGPQPQRAPGVAIETKERCERILAIANEPRGFPPDAAGAMSGERLRKLLELAQKLAPIILAFFG
jgi:hypothetical protein